MIANANFPHIAAERPVRAQFELGAPLNPVYRRRQFRKPEQITAVRSHQHSIIGLQPSVQLSERRELVRRIEEKKPAQLWVLDSSYQRAIRATLGEPDGEDGVVESPDMWRRRRRDSATVVIDDHIVGIHADFF